MTYTGLAMRANATIIDCFVNVHLVIFTNASYVFISGFVRSSFKSIQDSVVLGSLRINLLDSHVLNIGGFVLSGYPTSVFSGCYQLADILVDISDDLADAVYVGGFVSEI